MSYNSNLGTPLETIATITLNILKNKSQREVDQLIGHIHFENMSVELPKLLGKLHIVYLSDVQQQVQRSSEGEKNTLLLMFGNLIREKREEAELKGTPQPTEEFKKNQNPDNFFKDSDNKTDDETDEKKDVSRKLFK